jgi:hypothetical protein
MTIKHIVSWRLNGVTSDEKATQIEGIKELLLPLSAVIPELHNLRISVNAVFPEKNADVVLEAEFDSLEDLNVYLEHPQHVAAVGYIRSVVAERLAIDYEY